MCPDPQYGPGVRKYIEQAAKLIAERDADIARMKTMKFDTLSVHGLYSMTEALNCNQGAIIEPLYLATSQAYRDADDSRPRSATSSRPGAARGSPIRDLYLRMDAGPSSKLQDRFDASCLVTASGMSAIMSASTPSSSSRRTNQSRSAFRVLRSVSGGTFQHFSVRR